MERHSLKWIQTGLQNDFKTFAYVCFSQIHVFVCDRASSVKRWKQPTGCKNFFSFINLFKSALHVSGDKFVHPHEHFLTYIQLLVQCTDTAADRCHGTGRQQCRCIVPKAVYTVKKCSWGWTNLSPETCRADLNRLINEKVVASCWLITSLFSPVSNAQARTVKNFGLENQPFIHNRMVMWGIQRWLLYAVASWYV